MKALFRCAGSSLATVAIEFAVLTLLVSVLHVYYLAGALIAGAGGICVSFVLNRRWAFRARHARAPRQLCKHALVVVAGIGLGMALTALFVSAVGLPYQVGWLGGGAVVFLAWTFPMQRFFTYRSPPLSPALAA